MADFIGAIESTSFDVKDETAWLADPDVITIREYARERQGFFEKSPEHSWSFGWHDLYPSPVIQIWTPEEDEEPKEVDILAVIEEHIAPDCVAQISVSGQEKLRYIGGSVWFVTSKGVASFNVETCWQERLSPADLVAKIEALAEDVERIVDQPDGKIG